MSIRWLVALAFFLVAATGSAQDMRRLPGAEPLHQAESRGRAAWEAPPAPEVAFDPGLGTFYSQLGVLHVGGGAPRPFATRLGVGATGGTHTQQADVSAGLAGLVPVGGWWLDYNISNRFNTLARQWSYDMNGVELQASAEVLLRRPLKSKDDTFRAWGVGFRADSFLNRSFDELQHDTVAPHEDHSHLSQRLGDIFFVFDYATRDVWHRLRLDVQNDSMVGDGNDRYRTSLVALRYLQQRGDYQFRAGLQVDFFTSDHHALFVNTPSGAVYLNNGLPFEDRSQGLLGIELGASRFHRLGNRLGELGVDVTFGPDTEEIRDYLQNELIHRRLWGIPQVPLVDREDRFQFDLRVYYTVHF